MKSKTWLVLSALGLCVGAASAQSSVTLFGVLDLNARWLNNDGVKQYSLSQDGLTPSRLGVRGSEDLGGGLRASFWLEGAINPDTGTPNGQTWQRRSTVSIANQFGELRLGRDFTATYWNNSDFDPFGDTGLGGAGNLSVKAPAVPTGGAYDTLVRANNMVGYFLPSGIAGGLYGQFQVAAGENKPGNKYVGGRLGYASGPFNGAIAYGQTKLRDDVDGDNFNLGASWDFSVVKLSGFYGQIKVQDDKQNTWFVGARVPLGAWNLKLSYGHTERSGTVPEDVEGQKASQLAVGAVYELSRRTALYGTWSGMTNKGGAHFVVGSFNNVAGGGAAPDADSQGFEFGLRHSF